MRYKTLIVSLVLVVLLSSCAPAADTSQEIAQEAVDSEAGIPSSKVTMLIAPELADCVGEGPMKCMKVKYEQDEDWQFFYSNIEGFDYKEGYRYTLLVEKLEVKDPPQGGSSLKYVLVEVVEQVEEMPVSAVIFENTTWALTGLGRSEDLKGVLEKIEVTFRYDTATGQAAGSAGCNRYFGDMQVDPEAKTISVGFLGLTRMSCQESVNEQEAAFINILEQVTGYTVEGNQLTLSTDDGQMLVFEPAPDQE